jgi:hypothetical protein
MLDALMNSLFGCSHRRTSFPITPSRRTGLAGSNFSGAVKRSGTYVSCLDCGKEFDYNWKEMRLGNPVRVGISAHAEESYSVSK